MKIHKNQIKLPIDLVADKPKVTNNLLAQNRVKIVEKQQENDQRNKEEGIENEKPEPFSNFKTNVKTGKDLLDEWARKYKS